MSQEIQDERPRTPEITRRRPYVLRPSQWLLYVGIPIYLVITAMLFFFWVNPSLTENNEVHIAADSVTYMKFASSLASGENDPYVLGSLASFPNTFWGPVLLGLVFKSTVSVVLANYALLLVSLWLIARATELDMAVFLLLLFANVTMSVSMLSLNKEILDLFATSFFLYYLARGNRWMLTIALVVAAVCRYETCAIMVIYLALLSRWNPFRHARKASLVLATFGLSILLATVLASNLAYRMQEASATASSGGLLLLLDNLETHGLFFVAVVPKVLDNLFSELVNVSHWGGYSLSDPANSFFLLGNNIANVGLLFLLWVKHRFTLRSNLVYYACLNAIFMSTALIIQPRYFFGAYVVLCVECARRRPGSASRGATDMSVSGGKLYAT